MLRAPWPLTFLLELLHHPRHHVLVVRLSSLDDLDVQAVVNPLKLWNTHKGHLTKVKQNKARNGQNWMKTKVRNVYLGRRFIHLCNNSLCFTLHLSSSTSLHTDYIIHDAFHQPFTEIFPVNEVSWICWKYLHVIQMQSALAQQLSVW